MEADLGSIVDLASNGFLPNDQAIQAIRKVLEQSHKRRAEAGWTV
jgi:pyridoxal/pyridoxine/pyridoxamine kinase